jgi:predicted DCC family thiol-disulfide oxidoreductase YuxK
MSTASQTAPASQSPNDASNSPDHSWVLYDGDCNFCRSQIRLLKAFDRTSRLETMALQDPRAQELFSDLTLDEMLSQMWVLSPDGHKFGGASAVRYLSRKLPLLWPIMPILHIPGSLPLWRALYRWVARNRYRLGGKRCETDSCAIHFDKK